MEFLRIPDDVTHTHQQTYNVNFSFQWEMAAIRGILGISKDVIYTHVHTHAHTYKLISDFQLQLVAIRGIFEDFQL